MQCFKLVNGGFVDRLLIFDTLPERFLKDVRTREVAGLPRAWAKFLIDIGSLRIVFKTETTLVPDASYTHVDGRWYFRYTPIGKEPCFYVLEYQDVNADKDTWRAISEYVRMNVGTDVRLREKLEDMAIQMAPTPKDALSIEPEDIPVIPLPPEVSKEHPSDIVKPEERIIIQDAEIVKKKRGRPRKVVAVGA